MSNYVQTTIFTPKDTLPTTDPNKTIFGAQFDVEFGNISTSIATKVDTASAASLLSVNVTGSAIPANGIYLPSANTLGLSSNTLQRVTINANGAVTINAPTAGAALNVTGAPNLAVCNLVANGAAIDCLQIVTAAGQQGSAIFQGNAVSGGRIGTAGAAGQILAGSAAGDFIIVALAAGTDIIRFGTNNVDRLDISSTGAITINAATSGVGLTVTGVSTSYAVQVNSSASGTEKGLLISAGAASGDVSILVQNQAASATFFEIFGDGHGTLGPNATNDLSWTTAGVFAIAAPTAGVGLTVTGVSTSFAVQVSSSSSGTEKGLLVNAGAAVGDIAIQVENQAASTTFFEIFGDGHGTLGPNTTNDLSWTTAGVFAIAAPTAGVTFTVNGISGTHSTKISDSATNLFNAGFLETPQRNITANYTLVLSDSGRSIYITGTTASQTVTIPANASVAFPIATTIIIINISNQNWSVAITTDTLEWLPTAATGTRTLAAGGVMTLYKDTATHWLAWGFSIT